MGRNTVIALFALTCYLVCEAQPQDFFPEISDLPIAIKPDENVTLSCNASSHDVVLDDMDLLWFLVEPVDLDMVEVTTCSLMGSGSGSGSGGNGTVAGNDADIFGSDDHVIPLFTMLDQVESGFFFIADASVYQNGSYIVCVINNTDVGSCMSNYSTITGTVSESKVLPLIATSLAPSSVSVIPDTQTYERGDDVTLTCSSMGGPELLYQWQFNGNDLDGEMFCTLILSNVTASHGGEYTCMVSNIAGNDSASTIVYISPYFTAHPQDAGVSNGSMFSLICEAEGFPVPSYQWMRVGDPIRDDLNVTSMTLIFDPILFEDKGVYVCNVTSEETTISSDMATLTLAPLVDSISDDRTYQRGENISLYCSALGGPDVFYQWQFNGTNLDGENSSSLALFNVNVLTGGEYTCVVYNSAGNDYDNSLVYIFPYIVTEPENVDSSNGSVVILTCEAEAFPTPTYQWIRDEVMIRTNGLDVDSEMLEFSPVQFGDEGIYFCNVSSGESELLSSKVTLRVAPWVEEISASQAYERGEDVILNCSALGGPDVNFQWLIDGSNILGETSSSLTLFNVNASTGGEYTCVVSNQAGNDSASTSVFISPYFIVQPESTGGSNGSIEMLMCEAEAFPDPTYQWIREGEMIRSDLGIGSKVLTFDPLQFGDEGFYICNVTSGESSRLSEVVTLSVAPLIDSISDDQAYQRDQDVTLNCSALGGPDIFFQWLVNGSNLDGENSSTLILPRVNASTGGEYTCVVSNSAGNDTAPTSVFISPYFTMEPQDVGGLNGSTITLSCEAEAFPAPFIQWVKVGEEIRESLDIVSSGELVFDPLLFGDEGSYFCNVSSQGQSLQSQSVTLSVAPLVFITPGSLTYQRGGDVVLNCSVLGGPDTSYQWQFKDIDIDGENTSMLTLPSVNASNGGEYTCVVSNSAGNGSARVSVFISPYFVVEPQNENGLNGSIVTLPCEAEAFPAPDIQWVKVGDTLRDGLDIVSSGELVFDPLLFGDEGSYFCNVSSQGQSLESQAVTLSVAPLASVVPGRQIYQRGVDLTLNCSVLGGPHISYQWLFNDIDTDGENSSMLTLTSVNASDGGEYTCVVSNPAGNDSASSTVYIFPYFTIAPEDVESSNGDNVTLTCEAEAFPDPSYEWSKIDEIIREDVTGINSTSLSFEPVLFGDEGRYNCNVTSESGIIWSDAVLSVSPEGSVMVMPLTFNTQLGVVVTFTCEANGGPGNAFVWTKFLEYEVVANSSIINISVTTAFDGGVYSCNVSNVAGYEEANVTINVSPTIDVPLMDMTVSIEESAEFLCTASGFPPPSIEWLYNNESLNDSGIMVSTVAVNPYQVVSNLTVLVANVSDSGTYTCIATSTIDGSMDSEDATLTVQATPLQVVDVIAFNITSRSLSLEWMEPHSNNAPVQYYMVMFMDPAFVNEERNRSVNSTVEMAEIESLYPGIDYSFTVVAVNEIGRSIPSLPLVVRTSDEVPGSPPPNVTVMADSSTSIIVSWNEVPLRDQNGNITVYEIMYEPLQNFNGFIGLNISNVTGSTQSLTIMNLEEDVEYIILVRAYTTAGPGNYSDPITETTFEAEPSGPPTNVTVMVKSPTTILVSWSEVNLIDQNGNISNYEVLYTPLQTFGEQIESNALNVSGSELSVLLMDLQEYINYSISVRAYTSVGPGPDSNDIIILTPEATPASPPANVIAMAASPTSIDVMWNIVPPIDQNGVITMYEIQYIPLNDFGGQISGNVSNVSGSVLNITLLYLQEYVNYNISVRAYTSEGPGPYSNPEYELTEEDIPSSAPRNISAMAISPTTMSVQWETVDPIDENGDIIAYDIMYTPQQTFNGLIRTLMMNVSNFDLSVNLTELQEYVNYTVSVRANTSVGAGPYSNNVTVLTPEDAPSSPPANVSAVANSSTTIMVSWDEVPPIDQNGVIIVYEVMYTPMETFNGMIGPDVRNVSSSNLSVILEELEEFVNYTVVVRAFTRIGASNFSTFIVVQTLEDVPAIGPNVTNVSAASTRSVYVQWNLLPLIDQNGIIVNYNITLVPTAITANQSTVVVSTSNLNITIDNLVPHTNYSVTIVAFTSVGNGTPSIAVVVETPEDAPGPVPVPPEVPMSNITATSVILRWDPPPSPNGVITSYRVNLVVLTEVDMMNSRKKRQTASSVNIACIPEGVDRNIDVNPPMTSLQVIDLAPFTQYQFRVMASTTVGPGSFSSPRNFSTMEGVPFAVRTPVATAINSTSIEVSWATPLCPNGNITEYRLYYRQYDTVQTGFVYSTNGYTVVVVRGLKYTFTSLQTFRNYTFIVRAVIRANLLGSIDKEIRNRTLSGISSEPPTPPSNAATSQPLTQTQVPYLIGDPKQINTGIVTLCAVVVVEGPASGLSTYDKARPYIQGADFYITAAWNEEDVYSDRVPAEIVIGDDQVYDVNLRGTTVGYRNVPLKSGTLYSFFTRYDIQNEQNENQPFRVYSRVVVLQTPSPPSAAAAAVGTIFALLFVGSIIAIVIIIIYCWCRRNGFKYTRKNLEETGTNNSVELVQASFIKNHGAVVDEEETQPPPPVVTHDPVPIEAFGKYVKQHHGEDNELFSDEYKEVEPSHSPTSNDTRNPNNIQKNRYANIVAYDHSRVKLDLIPDEPNSDYINANFLDGYRTKNSFIAAQGPVPASVCDFWRMIWEQNVEYIVMVTNCEEKGRVKCHKYWPENSGTPAFYSPYHIYLQEALVLAEYTIRTFSLQKEGNKTERIVRQFHFTIWPDHGVPEYPSQLLHFVRKVMQEHPLKNGPMVVHCSAGVGRTGTFITLFTQLQRIRAEKTVDVFNFVRAMRYRRCYMVQTEDQYTFIHDALLEAIECGVTEVPARDVIKRYKKLTNPDPGRPGMREEFQKLARTIHHQIFRTFSMMPLHKNKNRYNDNNLLPYDKTSVRLRSNTGGSDYINASHVDGYHKQKAYIATQGPLPETVDDFWKMIWDQKTTTIVMLVKEKELGRVKCHKYWPDKGATNTADLQVIHHNETEFPDYVLREFKLVDSSDGSSQQVKQFHFKDWPEDPDQVPENSSGLIDLIGQVQKWQIASGDEPIVVHCSDGCGRTGVYIAISILLERLKTEGVVDVFQSVRTLRLQRPQTVANAAQYEFCYKTVLEFLDSFELYSNFK